MSVKRPDAACVGAALAEDTAVRVHLLDDGIEAGRHGQQVPDGTAGPGELLGGLVECGLQVGARGMALYDCAPDEAAMLPGIECGSMTGLTNRVTDRDQLMVL